MTGFDTPITTKTLAQSLAEGRIPAPDALRFAMQLAEALRKIHEEGRVHGSVSPSAISLDNHRAELMSGVAAPGGTTPYIAPEVLAGNQPDSRSDVFSLGAVIYEMLTGQPAFEGADRSTPAPSGSPAVDRFVESCLASDPDSRLQTIKRVMMELKLLHAAARWAETPAVSRWISEAVVRAELQRLEARVAAGLEDQEKIVAGIEQAITEAVAAFEEQLAGVGNELQASRDRANQSIEAAIERIVTQVQTTMDAISERIAQVEPSLAAVCGRIDLAEEKIAAAAARIESLAQSHAAAAPRLETLDEKASTAVSQILTLEQNFSTLAPRIDAAEQSLTAAVARIDAVEQKAAAAPDVPLMDGLRQAMDAAVERISCLEQALDAAHQRVAVLEQQPVSQLEQTVTALGDRLSKLAQRLDDAVKSASDRHATVTRDIEEVQKTLQRQSSSLESTRVSITQADDLVERVVDALESLQAIVLDRTADRAAAV